MHALDSKIHNKMLFSIQVMKKIMQYIKIDVSAEIRDMMIGM